MKYKTFCAANSGEGFISFFPSLLNEKKQRIYYIKGGPGCGKSTLLKKISEATDDAELIYCSGDPKSMDGIVLPKENAILIDATAPHSHEPSYPGVGGNLFDLGIGWDPSKLNKNAIIDLMDQKKTIYKNCYSLLRGAKYIYQGVFHPLTHQLKSSKIITTADKILRQNALWGVTGNHPSIQKRFLSGITPDGFITYHDTFCKLGHNVIVLEDRWMISYVMLQYIQEHLTRSGIDHIACYHPLLGEPHLQHLIIPSASLSIVSRDGIFPLEIPEENIIRKITIQGMMEKSYLELNKNKLSFVKRLERELINLAIEKLADAKKLHLKIEEEYAKGTDYSIINDLQEKLMNNLLT